MEFLRLLLPDLRNSVKLAQGPHKDLGKNGNVARCSKMIANRTRRSIAHFKDNKSSEYKWTIEFGLRECDFILSGKCLLMFQRNMSLPSSG